MELTVRLIGGYRFTSDRDELTIQFNEKTNVKRAMKKLGDKNSQIQKMLNNSKLEDLSSNTLILLSGREIGVLNGLETKINDGDEMVIIPVSHGG